MERLQGELEESRSLVVRNRELTSALAEARAQIVDLQAELYEARSVAEKPIVNSATPVDVKPDYEALTEKALASLKLGKQAPGYKAAAKAIAKFRELLQGG